MRFVINCENNKLVLINSCNVMSHYILIAIFINAATPTLLYSSNFSHLYIRPSFVSHYTLNTQYFCLLSHYAHFTSTIHLQHIHCSCFFYLLYSKLFLLLSTFTTYLFLLPYSDTQWLSHFYPSLIFQLRISSNFQSTLIPLSIYTHDTLTLFSSHFYITLTSHTHTTFDFISHYTHFTFTL